MNYFKARELAQSGRKGSNCKRIANNTWAIDHGNRVTIRLHHTDIVTFYLGGDVMLNTDGWDTRTTKSRIKEFSPYQVRTKKNVMSVWQNEQFIGLYSNNMILNGLKRVREVA